MAMKAAALPALLLLAMASLGPIGGLALTSPSLTPAAGGALADSVQEAKAANPSFSEENCKAMMDTKQKLGGVVPSNAYVQGCTEVCEKAKDMKEYWGDDIKHAAHACEIMKTYGCVYEGQPPKVAEDLGC